MSKGRYTTLGTTHYVYFVEDTIGRGVSGNVHRGREKKTGEIVAVKTLSNANYVTDKREFDIMRRLKHENVIKLYCIEKETVSKRDIIIMEYAKAGSLSDVLDKPENAYGLPEDEFLNFLKQLGEGIRYLWSENIVHRDLKPGNILIAVDKDGRYIYKLADFGAARQLRDKDEKFMSMHGTQEYLPPNVYERAVLRKPVFRLYDRSVDLWALGATIYQAATSHLPFQNLDGRDNKDAMFRILKNKKKNHISGKELPGGQVEYSDKMPATCVYSSFLKAILVRMLQQLFIDTDTETPYYDHFFESVDMLNNKVVMHVFFLAYGSQDRIYLDRQRKYDHLEETLANIHGLRLEEEILKLKILKGPTKLENMVDKRNMTLEMFPLTDPNNPLIVYVKQFKVGKMPPSIEPPVKEPPPRDEINVSRDLSDAKKLIGATEFIKARIEDTHRAQQLLPQVLSNFYNQISIKEQRVRIKQESGTRELEMCKSHIQTSIDTIQEFGSLASQDPDFVTGVQGYRQNLTVLEQILKHGRQTGFVEGRQIKSIQDKGCGHSTRCFDRVRACTADANKVVTEFYKHRDVSSLDSNMKQIHHYNRKQIHKDVRKLAEYHKNICYRGLEKMYQETVTTLARLERTKNDLTHREKNCDRVIKEVNEVYTNFQQLLKDHINMMRTRRRGSGPRPPDPGGSEPPGAQLAFAPQPQIPIQQHISSVPKDSAFSDTTFKTEGSFFDDPKYKETRQRIHEHGDIQDLEERLKTFVDMSKNVTSYASNNGEKLRNLNSYFARNFAPHEGGAQANLQVV